MVAQAVSEITQDWQSFYLAHRGDLVRYATPILGSREAAEDVVHDAFLKFRSAQLRASAPEQVLAFLYRIVRNLAFDTLKRRKVEARVRDAESPVWLVPQPERTPEEIALHDEQLRIVGEVLDGLPVEVRVAMEMHRFGGFTLEEVAERLGVSVATAHRYVKTAMMKIAVRLAG
jgi:RNA polymerase sigma factor (sigma-70 family)